MNNIPAELHLDTFTLIAECQDGTYSYYGDKTALNEGKACVYVLVMGKDFYVGSTSRINERFSGHFNTLKNGRCENNLLQESFNKHKGFKAYVIMFTQEKNEKTAENIMIRLLHPNLNRLIPKADLPWLDSNKRLWVLKDVQKEEKPEQLKTKDTSVVINGKKYVPATA